MSKTCPECGREWPVTSKALGCWLSHDPDLTLKHTLQAIADALAPISRERVRGLLNKLGEHRRRGNLRTGARAPVDLEARRRYYREYEKTPGRKAARKRRHKERMQGDPEYRERMRARWRAKYARRKLRRSEGRSFGETEGRGQ